MKKMPLSTERVAVAAPKQERHLSPEVLEKIMAKVRDINTPGTAYSSVDYHVRTQEQWEQESARVKDLFQFGLLGADEGGLVSGQGEVLKKRWINQLKSYTVVQGETRVGVSGGREGAEKYKRSSSKKAELEIHKDYRNLVVHFNVVGRVGNAEDFDPRKTQISQTSYAIHCPVTVLFDLLPYKEEEDPILFIKHYHRKGVDMDLRTYRPVVYDGSEKVVRDEKTGKILPESQFGFVLSLRVRPQLFRGLVLNDMVAEKNRWVHGPEVLQTRTKELAKIMLETYKENSKMLLPIYDVNGNLLWPKEMSYEEVKRFVAERDTSGI